MIPTIVEKQILNSLRTNKLKKQQTDKNLPPPHRCPPFFFFFTKSYACAKGAHPTWTADSM